MITSQRLLGSIYGQAIGDCMGEVAEGLTAKEIKSRFGYIEGFIKKPEFTDDTILTHLSVSAIINNDLVVDRLQIAATFVKHFDSIPRMGPTTKSTLLAYQTNPDFMPHTGSTNGAAMRAPAVAWLFGGGAEFIDGEIVDKTTESSLATHGADIAIDGACAIACAVSCACAGYPLSLVIRAGIDGARYRKLHPQPCKDQHNLNLSTDSGHGLADLLEAAVGLAKSASPDEAVRRFGCGIETKETIPLVFYLLGWCNHRENLHKHIDEKVSREETSRYALFKNAILMAVNMGGDTDTVAGIVGAILGGWAGIDNIPRGWVDVIDAEGFAQRFGIAVVLHVHNLEDAQK